MRQWIIQSGVIVALERRTGASLAVEKSVGGTLIGNGHLGAAFQA
jgi:hypothetical protein